jgi:membrane protein DedA with SNARE-associated domain
MSFADLITFFEHSKYFLFFLGSYVEGPAFMLGGGILWKLGEASFWPTYLALVAGDFIADMTWYAVGYFGARSFLLRWGRFLNVTPDILAKIERRFHKYHLSILVVTKLSTGLGFTVPTLITAGAFRIPLLRFAAIQFFGGLLWVFILMNVGYYFGNVLDLIPHSLQLAFGVAVIAFVLLAIHYAGKIVSRLDW